LIFIAISFILFSIFLNTSLNYKNELLFDKFDKFFNSNYKMFLENPAYNNEQFGWIEVICGSMFSGKTEELIRRVRRAKIANQKVKIFKPIIDSRSKNYIESHDENKLKSIEVKSSSDILNYLKNCDVVAIDEAQFFDSEIINVCNSIANQGIRVIVAGLDMDYLGNPFGPMPNLMAISEYVTKVHAVCKKSGNVANYSYRKNKKKDIVVIGEKDKYEPLSRSVFFKKMKKNKKK
tara:strand:+ start:3101 stop:3805 length:705 start_codon:yes stop_codon:yes gene_type:complete